MEKSLWIFAELAKRLPFRMFFRQHSARAWGMALRCDSGWCAVSTVHCTPSNWMTEIRWLFWVACCSSTKRADNIFPNEKHTKINTIHLMYQTVVDVVTANRIESACDGDKPKCACFSIFFVIATRHQLATITIHRTFIIILCVCVGCCCCLFLLHLIRLQCLRDFLSYLSIPFPSDLLQFTSAYLSVGNKMVWRLQWNYYME